MRRRVSTRHIRVTIALAAIAASGCSPGRQAAEELDHVAASLDKYGFAGISAPFLTTPQRDSLKTLDLNKPASWFFDHALTSVQGGVRTADAMAIDTQIAIRINIEQALATIAQFNRARSIADVKEAQRKAGVQKKMLETVVGAAAPPPGVTAALTGAAGTALGLPPGTPGAALLQAGTAMVNPADNPLVKSTLGMLDVIANSPLPDTDPLPGFKPSAEAPPDKPPFSTADRVALGAVGTSFTPFRAFPDEPFQISAREALLIASGDWVTQSILNWIEYPAGNRMGDYELFFCPMIVSVKPGYQTRHGFQADVSVTVDLAREPKDACGKPTRPHELEFLSEQFPDADPPVQVAGVVPVVDAQVLDLVSSRRRLYSMAFQLAAVGFGSQANVFLDYAKKLEQDAQTRTALTVASAYTLGGSTFGFRIEPQYVALKNPAALDASPGDVLQSRTFPAMAMLLVHRSYLRERRTDVNVPNGMRSEQVNASGSPASVISSQRNGSPPAPADKKFDYLVLRTDVRWSPVHAGWFNLPSRVSEVDMWKRAESLDKASEWIDPKSSKCAPFDGTLENHISLSFLGTVPSHYQRAHLASRLLTLRQMALDTQALIRIDHLRPSDEVIVYSVTPDHGWLAQPTTLTIYGRGFADNAVGVTVGGRACNTQTISDECLIVTVAPWQDASATEISTPPSLEPQFQNFKGSTGQPLFISPIMKKPKQMIEYDGEVVIISKKPVLRSAPPKAPYPSSTVTTKPGDHKANELYNAAVGWVRFDHRRPAEPAKDKGGGGGGSKAAAVEIPRDPTFGRIAGAKTNDNVNESLLLLDLLAPALANEAGCGTARMAGPPHGCSAPPPCSSQPMPH